MYVFVHQGELPYSAILPSPLFSKFFAVHKFLYTFDGIAPNFTYKTFILREWYSSVLMYIAQEGSIFKPLFVIILRNIALSLKWYFIKFDTGYKLQSINFAIDILKKIFSFLSFSLFARRLPNVLFHHLWDGIVPSLLFKVPFYTKINWINIDIDHLSRAILCVLLWAPLYIS